MTVEGMSPRVRNSALAVGLLVLALLLIPRPPTADADSISVGISAPSTSVTLGRSADLSVQIKGASSGELDTASLVIQSTRFPYKNFTNLETFSSVSDTERLRVSPVVNSRFRAVLSLGDGSKIQTQALTLYVKPIVSGDRYVSGPNTLRYTGAQETYSRQLAKRWFRVPVRLRTMYFYQRCLGSKDFVLRAKRRAKTRLSETRMRLTFPGFTFRDSVCGERSYDVLALGTSKLPGYLANGDDGAGIPSLSAKKYRIWQRVAGDRRVSASIFRRIGFF